MFKNRPLVTASISVAFFIRTQLYNNQLILSGMDIEPVLELIGRWLRPRPLLHLAPARGRGRQPRLIALCLAEAEMITVCAAVHLIQFWRMYMHVIYLNLDPVQFSIKSCVFSCWLHLHGVCRTASSPRQCDLHGMVTRGSAATWGLVEWGAHPLDCHGCHGLSRLNYWQVRINYIIDIYIYIIYYLPVLCG